MTAFAGSAHPPICFAYGQQDTKLDKAWRIMDGAIYVGKNVPLGSTVKVNERGVAFMALSYAPAESSGKEPMVHSA